MRIRDFLMLGFVGFLLVTYKVEIISLMSSIKGIISKQVDSVNQLRTVTDNKPKYKNIPEMSQKPKYKNNNFIILKRPVIFRFGEQRNIPGGSLKFTDYDRYQKIVTYQKIANDKISIGHYQPGDVIILGQYSYSIGNVIDGKLEIVQL